MAALRSKVTLLGEVVFIQNNSLDLRHVHGIRGCCSVHPVGPPTRVEKKMVGILTSSFLEVPSRASEALLTLLGLDLILY